MILNLLHNQKNGSKHGFTETLDVYVKINPLFFKLLLPGIGHNGIPDTEA